MKSGCGIQISQTTPTKFSKLFKHNYGKLSWKFGDHSLNFSFVHGPSWLRILESIHRYGVIFTFCKKFSKGHCEAMLDVKTSLKSQKFTWPLACVYISFVKLKNICSWFFSVLFKNLKDISMILHDFSCFIQDFSRFFTILHVSFKILNEWYLLTFY